MATAKVPENIKQDLAMVCGCIGGAEHVDNIKIMLEKAGFKDIRMITKDNSRQIIFC